MVGVGGVLVHLLVPNAVGAGLVGDGVEFVDLAFIVLSFFGTPPLFLLLLSIGELLLLPPFFVALLLGLLLPFLLLPLPLLLLFLAFPLLFLPPLPLLLVLYLGLLGIRFLLLMALPLLRIKVTGPSTCAS